MIVLQCVSLFYLLVSTGTRAVLASPSGTENVENTESDGSVSVAALEREQPESEEGARRLKEELKRELKEELLESLWKSNNAEVQSSSRPHHHHHHYHHHHHCQGELTADVTSGTILAQELLALKALLQATETKLQMTETRLQAVENRQQDEPQTAREDMSTRWEEKLNDTLERLEAAEQKVAQCLDQSTDTQTTNGTFGSTFVRWGRTTCPNSTQLVYRGVVGGSDNSHRGAAANRLCLTLEAQYDGLTAPNTEGRLYGAEYYDMGDLSRKDIPCSVCRAAQSSTIMVPGTLTCPQGWIPQYTGHIASGNYLDPAATEYLCLDRQPEDTGRPGSAIHAQYANFFMYTVTYCSVLPCPPYKREMVATCVVCSK